jgi:hypothetical protein
LCINTTILFFILRPIYFLLFIFIVLSGEYIVVFTKILTIYHSWIHPLYQSPLSSSSSTGIVSPGIIFPFINMCTQSLHYIHPPKPIPHLCPPPTGTCSPTSSTNYALLFSNFVKEKRKKNWHFCLSKIVTQGVSL